MRTAIICATLVLAAGAARADISYLESGYVTFEGCEWDKLIDLQNGYVWQCRQYGYRYHYGKMTVLEVNGNMKLCVGDLEEAVEEFPDGDCYDGTLYQF